MNNITNEIRELISKTSNNVTIERYLRSESVFIENDSHSGKTKFYDDINSIYERCPVLAKSILTEDVNASLTILDSLAFLSAAELDKIVQSTEKCGFPCKIYINNNTIGSGNSEIAVKSLKPGSKPVFPFMPIKQIPEYNPDAELSSLILTIPSWIESICRKCNNTDFSKASKEVRIDLSYALTDLEDCIFDKLEYIERSLDEQ